MKILIEGVRGEGKSFIAMFLTRILKEKGFNVNLIGYNEELTRAMNKVVDFGTTYPPDSIKSREILILDISPLTLKEFEKRMGRSY